MKKVLLSILAMVAFAMASNAQSVIDADDGRNPNDFYQHGIVVGKRAMPYPSVRENDVIWESVIWREIDYNEKFNQFFYFPKNAEQSTQGRISLVNLIMRGVRNGEIPVYEDDDMEKELDLNDAIIQLAGAPYTVEEEIVDEYGNPVYDDETDEIKKRSVVKTRSFDSTSAVKIKLKEKWYIDKQDTRQKVRIVGLSFYYQKENAAGERNYTWSWWIPMDDMRVRQVFVNANAYDENNDVVERSYDDIFIQRYFDSYIIRESNVYNRSIAEYVADLDAVIESQRIEEKIFDIESDMWEY